jgi:hypothetical protein
LITGTGRIKENFMVLGVISIVLGVIFGISSFVAGFSVGSAPQQTVQYLGYVCFSVFLVGGFILIKMQNIGQELLRSMRNYNQAPSNTTPLVRKLDDQKRCSRCKKSVDAGYTACPYCGGSEFE